MTESGAVGMMAGVGLGTDDCTCSFSLNECNFSPHQYTPIVKEARRRIEVTNQNRFFLRRFKKRMPGN